MNREALLIYCGILIAAVSAQTKLETLFEWNYVNYTFDTLDGDQKMSKMRDYNPKACVVIQANRAPDGRIFLTVVRDVGVPASLTTISNKKSNGQYLLQPYPNWETANESDCNNIISIYRMYMANNLLYVIDNGKVGDDKRCSAKLVMFALDTDTIIKRIRIADSVSENKNDIGLLINVQPYKDEVFFADSDGKGVVALQLYRNKQCRIESSAFLADPKAANQTVNGTNYYLPDGPFGLAIVRFQDGTTFLYVSILANTHLARISLPNMWSGDQHMKVETLPCAIPQTGPLAVNKYILLMSQVTENRIVSWDTRKPCTSENIHTFVKDDDRLQFPSGLQIVPYGRYSEVYITSNRYQKVATNTLDLNEVNFRVLRARMNNPW